LLCCLLSLRMPRGLLVGSRAGLRGGKCTGCRLLRLGVQLLRLPQMLVGALLTVEALGLLTAVLIWADLTAVAGVRAGLMRCQ
jgi:hypothetical protein